MAKAKQAVKRAVKKTATVDMMQSVKNQIAEIEVAAKAAIINGVMAGVGEVLTALGSKVGSVPSVAPKVARRGAKKAESDAAAKDGGEGKGKKEGKQAKPRPRNAGPRQRGSLAMVAKQVFEHLSANPNIRNEDVAKALGLDAKDVSAAMKWLRGYDGRGNIVRDALVELPNGDQRRYTIYRVVDGAKFPEAQEASSDGGSNDIPADLLPSDGDDGNNENSSDQNNDGNEPAPESGGADASDGNGNASVSADDAQDYTIELDGSGDEGGE